MIRTEEYMSKPVITENPNASAAQLTKLMDEHNIGSIVVVDDNGILGIVTERDIIRKVLAQDKNPSQVLTKDIMTEKVVSVNIEASIMEIAANMKKHTMRRVVVTDGENRPVGIVTSSDLIGLLV